jgi:arylsulfatase A-like enzyme
MTQTEDALRITLSEAHRDPRDPGGERLHGDFYVPLPDLKRGEWSHVLVRARTSDDIRDLTLQFNLGDPTLPDADQQGMFQFGGEQTPVIQDGSVQTYVLRADWSPPEYGDWEDPWQELGLVVNAGEPASIDIVSMSLIPKETMYAGAPVGVRTDERNEAHRRTLYTHAPGRVEYRVRVPQEGRLDVGLGVIKEDSPVTFRIVASKAGKEEVALFEETYDNPKEWGQRSVDLSSMAGKTVRIALEADAVRAGTVALWSAPTLTGTRSTKKPNVIFYIIDGAYKEFMSVYGYNRRTTPNLEKLASEGVVFEQAYSNSTWSKPSTTSFMTSLHHSVLGGMKTESDPLPDNVVTMAQHFHRAGYSTAVITTNPYCGKMSSLDRGVDFLREAEAENNLTSSRELHEDFWNWRESFPGEPYWVHFQTTDVHGGRFKHEATLGGSLFDGIYIESDRRKTYRSWKQQLWDVNVPNIMWIGPWTFPPLAAFEKTGIDRLAYFRAYRDLLDEAMAHNDYQIGRMVERLKAKGEWENTLFIVASDHGHGMAYGLQEHLPDHWDPLFRPMWTRIPLIIVWPGRISPGQRFGHAVSLIDVLPTVLELVGLPKPDVMQGQSLVPLLLGEKGWKQRPIILDEFYVDLKTDQLYGNIEVVDGRWGASLEIDSRPEEDRSPYKRRPTPVLIYDLWNDPYCLHSLHEERADLVKKYNEFLQVQLQEHRELAKHFIRSGQTNLTAEQLRTLRSLGYIR